MMILNVGGFSLLKKLIKQPNLTADLISRINDCDELALLRALKRISNTEIAAILSMLPMEQVNQILIILPQDIANRVIACGFGNKRTSSEVLRKFFAALDSESKATRPKLDRIPMPTITTSQKIEHVDVPIPMMQVPESTSEPKPFDDFSDDRVSAASLFLLDTIGKIVGNSFRKH